MKINLTNRTSLGKWARGCLIICGLLCGLQAQCATFTWTGADLANDHWNDPDNWTGGTGIPNFADDVIIPSSTPTVIINCHAVCQNFSGSGALSGSPIYTLRVFGDFKYGGIIWTGFSGDIHLEALTGPADIESFAGNVLNNNVYINSPGVTFNIIDDLYTTEGVFLVAGTLNVNGSTSLQAKRFFSNYSSTRALNYSNGYIAINGSWQNQVPQHSWDVNSSLSITSNNNSSLKFISTNDASFSSVSQTYNGLVEFDATLGNARMYGAGNTFDILNLQTTTYIERGMDINDLGMSAGSVYTILSGETLSVWNSWIASGSCNQLTTLKSTHSGQDAFIDFLGTANPTTVQLFYLIIEDVISSGSSIDWGTGGYVPTMVDNIYNMTNESPDWPATAAGPTTMYWVGGDGDWSLASNWSPNTGCIPDPLTTVVFDGSSGFGAGDVCTLDISNAVCATMDWQNTVFSGAIFNSSSPANHLTIYGSLNAPSVMNWSYNGYTHFKDHSGGQTVDVTGQTFLGPTYFEGSGGGWGLSSSFISNHDVYVTAGSFNTLSQNMSIRAFYADIFNNRDIDISNSTITCIIAWDIYSQPEVGGGVDASLTSFVTSNSTIILTSGHFQGYNDEGNTYNNLELNNANGTQYLYGINGNTFDGYVTFLGNGVIPYTNTIGATSGDLTFTAGKSYTLGATQTLSNNSNLIALGSCTLGYIYIKGGGFTKNLGIDQWVEYCVIKNNVAATTGTVNFDGDNSILLGSANGIWSVISPYNGPLYFQASGTNDWNDPANWFWDAGYTNNGSPPCPPNPLNDVYFSNTSSTSGSFSLTSATEVDVDVSNAFCRGMYWGENDPIYWGQHTAGGLIDLPPNMGIDESVTNSVLHVFGEMMLQNSMIWDYSGQVMFEADAAGQYRIYPASQVFQNEVIFDGHASASGATNQADWHLKDNFETYNGVTGMNVMQGTLTTDGFDVKTGHLHSMSGNDRGLDIIGSSIELRPSGNQFTNAYHNYAWYSTLAGLSVSASGSDISIDNVTSGGWTKLYAESVSFNDVTFESNSNAEVRGDNASSFNNATFLGNGYLYCDNTFNGNLTFSPGFVYTLTSGTDQFISSTGNLLASGTLSQTVFIKPTMYGTGNEASITKDGGIICIDYASIRDNDAVSVNGAQFFDGPNGFNVDNNTGWAFTGCTPATLNGCVGDPVSFSTQFSGSAYSWDFGDGGSSTIAAPSYAYTATGTYTVSVTITNGTTQDIEYFTAVIATSCCQEASDPNYTNISGTISADVVWPAKVYVSANVFVTSGAVLEVTNSDVVFALNTGIYVEDNSHMESVNSTYRPCNPADEWNGIDLSEDATGKFNENIIIGAASGLAIVSDGAVESSNNQFVNCEKGMYLAMNNDSPMDHAITGNTFLLNKDRNFTTGSPDDFFGVQIVSLAIDGIISQNDFVYSSSLTTDDRFYGIHNNGGEMVASENNFTNVTFPYFQMGAASANTFENNEIDYNQAVATLYSTPSELVGVTISGASTATYVSNNSITMTYQSGPSSTGIYCDVDGTVSHGNTIVGLQYGIKYIQCDGEISRNAITDAEIGIFLNEAIQCDVMDNEVNASSITGISLLDCNTDISVRRNTVKNDPMSTGTVGIEYILTLTTGVSTVDFTDNCVYDTENAMYFDNQSGSNPCNTLPDVIGNYLFTYTSHGIYIDNFAGVIGNPGNPSRNSFVPNVPTGAAAPWDIREISACGVSVYGYWPMTINTLNVVDMGTGANDNSYASCGNQTLREGNLSAFQAYINDRYPIDFIENQFVLKSDFEDEIAKIDQSKRGQYALTTYGILASNKDMAQIEVLISGLENSQSLTADDLRWINYYYEVKTGNFELASEYINEITAEDKDEADLLFTEKVRLTLSKNQSDLRSLSIQDSAALKAIDDQKGAHAAMARDMIHVAKSGHPFIYNTDLPNRNPVAGAANVKQAEVGAMLVYPNPTRDDFMVLFNVESLNNARLTVTNVLGVQLINQTVNGNTRQLQLNVSDLPAGLYTVSLFNNDALLDAVQLVKQ